MKFSKYINLSSVIAGAFLLVIAGISACNTTPKEFPLHPVHRTQCVLTKYDILDTNNKVTRHSGALLEYDTLNRVTSYIELNTNGDSGANSFSVVYENGLRALQTGLGTYSAGVVYTLDAQNLIEHSIAGSGPDTIRTEYTYDTLKRLITKKIIKPGESALLTQYFGIGGRRPYKKVLAKKNGSTETHILTYDIYQNLLSDKIQDENTLTEYFVREYTYDVSFPAISQVAFIESEDPNFGSKDRNANVISSIQEYAFTFCGNTSPEPRQSVKTNFLWDHPNQYNFPDTVFITTFDPCTQLPSYTKAALQFSCK
ncbi:MAG: hypothetical protein V4543_06770 [Bacteroidota bacterium]